MGTSFGRDRHTTTSLHLLSTSRRITIKMNSAILLALFASAAYANPAANPMAALLATTTPEQVEAMMAMCTQLAPMLPGLYKANDVECRTTCVEDTAVNCDATPCTVTTTILAARGGTATMTPPQTIDDLIRLGQLLPEEMRSCLTQEMYQAAEVDAFENRATPMLVFPADSPAAQGRVCVLDLAAKMDAVCPALEAAAAAAAGAAAGAA